MAVRSSCSNGELRRWVDRLTGDVQWPVDTPFETAVGEFHVSLRTPFHHIPTPLSPQGRSRKLSPF